MKKFHLLSLLLSVCSCSIIQAQLSGTVTINSAAPASASNFQSFNAFANQLNTQGVSGPLVVNVLPNVTPYTEQVTFSQTPGVSATNSIVINGNNNLLTYSQGTTAQPWTLLLNGADYMTFKNLRVSSMGTLALACNLTGNADHNTFNFCTFTVPPNATSQMMMPLSLSGFSNAFAPGPSGNYNTFNNCFVYNGDIRGIGVRGPTSPPYSTNNAFLNCTVNDWNNIGIESHDQINQTVSYNSFGRPTRLNPAACTGIYFYTPQGATSCIGNCISNFYGAAPTSTNVGQGIVYSNTVPGLAPSFINQNLIRTISNNPVSDIAIFMMNGSCRSNTIIMDNNLASNSFANSAAIGVSTHASIDSLRFLNNFISLNPGTSGTKYGIMLTSSTGILVNRNVFYLPTGTPNYYFGSAPGAGSATSFSVWQNAGYDVQGTHYASNPNITLNPNCATATLNVPVCNFSLPQNGVCAGGTVIFNDQSTNSPNAWVWGVSPSANLSSSTSQSVGITFLNPGIYSVSVVASNTIGTGIAITKTINILPLPSIQITPTTNAVCMNSQITLTASGAATYVWNNGSTTPSISVSPTATANYTVVGTGANSCVNSAVKTILVYPLPTLAISISPTLICAGESITLTASGANTYLWDNGAQSANVILNPITNTNFTVTGTTVFGCSNTASISALVHSCTGVLALNQDLNFKIFPNPSSGKFTLQLANYSNSQVSIYNVNGDLVYKQNIDQAISLIDISQLAKGIYLLQIKQADKVLQQKIVRE